MDLQGSEGRNVLERGGKILVAEVEHLIRDELLFNGTNSGQDMLQEEWDTEGVQEL